MEYWDRTASPLERVALRASAVQAVSMGERKRQVAQRFGVTRQTLHNWVVRHRRGGTAALAASRRARRAGYSSPRRRHRSPTRSCIVSGDRSRGYTRWTKKAIAAFVEQTFGIRFSAWQVDSHLRRWGFESHKEVRRAFMSVPGQAGARTTVTTVQPREGRCCEMH